MKTYQESIAHINIAEATYLWRCDRANTAEEIGEALAILRRAKQAHRDQFGTLRMNDAGDWC